MEKIESIQKKLLAESQKLKYPRYLKQFDFNKKVISKSTKFLSKKDFIKGFGRDISDLKIHTLSETSGILQNKFIKYFKAEAKIDKYLLGLAKNHFIIEIKLKSDTKLIWDNNLSILSTVLIVVSGPGNLEIIEKQKHSDQATGQVVMVEVGSDARVNYSLLLKKSSGFAHLYYHSFVAQDAYFNWQIAIDNQAHFSSSFINTAVGQGAEIKQVIGSKLASSGKTYLLSTNDHQVPHTIGEIVFKGLAEDSASGMVEGMIRIDKRAKFTNSYLQDDALLLSPQAKISAIPKLEILNNEVKASHGTIVGRLDEKIIFYLMSRGLSAEQAKQLIVNSFMQIVINKVADEQIKKEFKKILF